MESDRSTWPGHLGAPTLLKADLVARLHVLADAAKLGSWPEVFRLLERDLRSEGPNVWRPGGTSGFSPLHQAAWHGASPEVVNGLLALGAWRTLPTLDGRTAADIAQQRGNLDLLTLLEPPKPFAGPAHIATLDRRLDEVVSERAVAAGLEEKLRPLPTRILQEVRHGEAMWFPIPGMYGGFSIELRHRFLLVESWSRVVGGSGVAHVISKDLTAVVDQGFV